MLAMYKSNLFFYRSVENLWIMRKVFFFLLFMVLILPSIGLTTLR